MKRLTFIVDPDGPDVMHKVSVVAGTLLRESTKLGLVPLELENSRTLRIDFEPNGKAERLLAEFRQQNEELHLGVTVIEEDL